MAERVKLTKARLEILAAARDYGNAFAIYAHRAKAGGSTKRCIRRLLSEDLLHNLPGKKFGTLTDAGRSALSSQENDRG